MTDSLALERHERILAAGSDVSGRWVVATNLAIHLPGESGAPHHRVPWEQVEHAEWDRDAELLRVTETAPLGEPQPTSTFRFEQPDVSLLGLIRERITASVVFEQRVALRGRRGIRVIARRAPGVGTALLWAVAFDEGIDPDDPEILAAAERALAAVRAEVEP